MQMFKKCSNLILMLNFVPAIGLSFHLDLGYSSDTSLLLLTLKWLMNCRDQMLKITRIFFE